MNVFAQISFITHKEAHKPLKIKKKRSSHANLVDIEVSACVCFDDFYPEIFIAFKSGFIALPFYFLQTLDPALIDFILSHIRVSI